MLRMWAMLLRVGVLGDAASVVYGSVKWTTTNSMTRGICCCARRRASLPPVVAMHECNGNVDGFLRTAVLVCGIIN
jgi:hypothetical protein